MKQSSSCDIHLSVRVRPAAKGQELAVDVDECGVLHVGIASSVFSFPHSVVKGSDQNAAFEALASRLLEKAKEGYNCTLMAYGQTGSGKTHTMFGPPGCLTEAAVDAAGGGIPESWGLFPRSLLHLMAAEGIEEVHASAIEIYHESVFDLMDDRKQLQIGSKEVGLKVGGAADELSTFSKATVVHGVHPAHCTCHRCFTKGEVAKEQKKQAREARIQAAKEASAAQRRKPSAPGVSSPQDRFTTVGETLIPLRSPADVARFARTVEATRTAKSHLLNDRSSRSHCLVKTHLTMRRGGKSKRLHLLFVDLAGSERVARTGAQGVAKAEATAINQSLTCLGRVIKQLGDKKASHVAYRDSTLTMLLRDSFGGNSCTTVVINVASEAEHVEETRCTLSFGERMAVVRNTPTLVVAATQAASIKSAEAIKTALQLARTQLADLAVAGKAGGIVKTAPPSEQRSLLEGMSRLEKAQTQVRALVAQRVETIATGANVSAIEAEIRSAKALVENLAPVVGRQQTIKSLWAEAAPDWKKKASEVKQLEHQLALVQC